MTVKEFEKYFIDKATQSTKGNKDFRFVIDSYNKKVLDFFYAYMVQDLETLQKLKGNVEKGILIQGTNGSGKSFLFETLDKIYIEHKVQHWRIHFNEAIILPEKYRRYISNPQIASNDLDFYEYYSKGAILIDDLGAEIKLKHFGNEVEIVDQLIQLRYNIFKKKNLKTFVTTNLSLEDIKRRYGLRSYDRIFEMFNILQLNGPTRRK